MIQRVFGPMYFWLIVFNSFALAVCVALWFFYSSHVPLAIMVSATNLLLIVLQATITKKQRATLRSEPREANGTHTNGV